jgi:hypothetical protein
VRLLINVLTGPATPWEDDRCCDDRPSIEDREGPAWPVRWPRKLRAAVGPSVSVFRRQIAESVTNPVEIGTPVVSSSGRSLGSVSGLVVELPSGRASYTVTAVSESQGRVLLLPRTAVREREDAVVIEDRVLAGLARMTA